MCEDAKVFGTDKQQAVLKLLCPFFAMDELAIRCQVNFLFYPPCRARERERHTHTQTERQIETESSRDFFFFMFRATLLKCKVRNGFSGNFCKESIFLEGGGGSHSVEMEYPFQKEKKLLPLRCII
jgi:hypothetical protein